MKLQEPEYLEPESLAETSVEEPKSVIKANVPFANLKIFTGTWNLGKYIYIIKFKRYQADSLTLDEISSFVACDRIIG